MKKLKDLIKTNEFKASAWTLLSAFVLVLPFLIIFFVALTQYTYVTTGFWTAILLFSLILVLVFAFSNVIYLKLLNNYQNKELESKEYLKVFINELISPICLGLFIVIFIVYLDQLSKISAMKNLTYGQPVVFIKHILNWTLAYNKGAAWSMCSEHTNILAIISLVASIIITFFMKDFDIRKKPIYSLGVAFMLGGTIGNMIDRFMRTDGVIDFIELGFIDFPIFNLADSFLVVGTIALMISIVFNDFILVKKNKSTNVVVDIDEGVQND